MKMGGRCATRWSCAAWAAGPWRPGEAHAEVHMSLSDAGKGLLYSVIIQTPKGGQNKSS